MDRRTALSAIVTSGIGLGVAGCGEVQDSGGGPEYPNETHTHEPEREDLEVENLGSDVRNNEVWPTGELSNLTGRPIHNVKLRFIFLDELDEPISNPDVVLHGLRHGDTREIERYWRATYEQKMAVRGMTTEIEEVIYGDTRYFAENPEDCDDVERYMCDGDVKITEYNDGSITVPSGGTEWTVYGEVENISDEKLPGRSNNRPRVVAHYVQDGTLTDGWFASIPALAPGETYSYRITFPHGHGLRSVRQNKPAGSLRMTLSLPR